ncbi:MAG: Uncharacterized protein LiPW39_223 [Parcubacteria group bacterium LiPW_39]|nr:MAG: Uncharacterized protein LiPW39_223 [Parcubacteria group bacterium LiPW_39]
MPENNPDSGQLFMPGPQFNQAEPSRSWFGRHSSHIVIGIIIALLVVGGIYFYRSYQQRKAALKPALENILPGTSIPTATVSPAASPTPPESVKAQPTTGVPAEIKKADSQIVAKAAKGHGATHLARSALKEYLKEKPELAAQLKVEHKIYIEDYLQKHTAHSKILKVGDEISFSNELIKEAIDQAQKLTDSQIKNLSQYVPLVPSLT